MDNIQEKIITISKVEKTLTSTNKNLIKVKDQENKGYQLWPIKQDGTESKAYQYFKTLTMDGIGQTVRISFKEEQSEYQGKPVTFRTIIGMSQTATGQVFPPKNTTTGFVGAKKAVVEPDWDKISWGKCKYGFLIEAFKMGKDLAVAEPQAEAWADAAMEELPKTPAEELGINTDEIQLDEPPF